MVKNNKGFIGAALAVIIVVALSAGGYWYWKNKPSITNTPTATTSPTPTKSEEVLALPTPPITPIDRSDWITTDIRQKSGYQISHPSSFTENEEDWKLYPDGYLALYGKADDIKQNISVFFDEDDGGDNFDSYINKHFTAINKEDNGESTGGVLYQNTFKLDGHKVGIYSYKHIQDRTMQDLVPDSVHTIVMYDTGSDVIRLHVTHDSLSPERNPLDNLSLNMLATIASVSD